MTDEICYPPGANWSCAYTAEELENMWATPETADRMEIAEAYAWMSLASLTGWQIGMCPIVVRPCAAGCQAPGTYMVAPVLTSGNFAGVRPGSFSRLAPYVSPSGAWVNSCLCRSNDCGCAALCEAILPGPVGGVVEVWVDGQFLDPAAYRVDNGNRLVRLDGGCWPSCQDLSQDALGPDAFSVKYYLGAAPNNVILWAIGKLANEFFKACNGGDCALPGNAISVARSGVSIQLEPGMFPGGRTNVPEADALIDIYNPFGLRATPVIASPDTRRARITTVR
jgi:hypothetical protein